MLYQIFVALDFVVVDVGGTVVVAKLYDIDNWFTVYSVTQYNICCSGDYPFQSHHLSHTTCGGSTSHMSCNSSQTGVIAQ